MNIGDNTPKDDSHNKDEKLFKIRPVMQVVRNNYVAVEHEQTNSSDEEIISIKITEVEFSNNPTKNHKVELQKFYYSWSKRIYLRLHFIQTCKQYW